jgi:uncharacterized membrane protein YraQ (UPF0718 family)
LVQSIVPLALHHPGATVLEQFGHGGNALRQTLATVASACAAMCECSTAGLRKAWTARREIKIS